MHARKTIKFHKHRHKKSKWITNGILNSIKFRDSMYKELQQTPRETDKYTTLKTNLSTYNKIVKKNIREAKMLYYTESFDKQKHDIKKTWKLISEIICKASHKRPAFDNILVNDKVYKDKTDMANQFNSFFVNVGPDLASEINSNNKLPYTNYFLAPSLISPLTLIINQSLVTGIFPTKLTIAKVAPLHKKGHSYLMTNYRPVSLLSAISKLFEKVVYNQLYTHFQTYKLFYFSQYGFRKRHSTEYAALELIDKVLQNIDDKNATFAIYMDLSKAFDTLNHRILINKLSHYGIHGNELAWFSSYLCDRIQYVEIESHQSHMLYLQTGVPQGSILGPLIFLIYMNDAPNISPLLEFILYADDTTGLCPIRLSGNENPNINFEHVEDQRLVSSQSIVIKYRQN